MAFKDQIPCVGYVYTGQFLLRAKTVKDLVVYGTGNTHIEGEVSLFPWYTYRRVENAIARLQEKKILQKDTSLNLVAYTPELVAELKKDPLAKARLTRDHILHMLTAGQTHLTAQDLEAYGKRADAMFERMVKANEKASQSAA